MLTRGNHGSGWDTALLMNYDQPDCSGPPNNSLSRALGSSKPWRCRA